MASRLAALLPRLVALTVIWLLGTSTITFAAGSRTLAKQPNVPAVKKEQTFLVVPDVRRQAYVFAKGILEDSGFAWRVEGDVEGYAANTVVVQDPAPGTRVLDNGTPTVVVRLQRNLEYQERGLPQNSAPYPGDELVLASEAAKKAKPKPKVAQPAKTESKKATKPKAPAKSSKPAAKAEEQRKAEFQVPGAPPEPADEMPLT